MNNTLTMLDILWARILVGDLVYKTSEYIEEKDTIYKATFYSFAKHEHYWCYVMHPDLVNEFIDECTANNTGVIPFFELVKAEKEAMKTKPVII